MVIALAVGLSACGKAHHARDDGARRASTYQASLELNNGRKWVIVPTMMVHLRALEQAVRDSEQQRPGPDHAALAAEIQEHLGRLVTNCTMEGKAHDELHKWLMPLLGISAEYAQAADPQVQEAKRQQIKESFVVFNAYFE